MAFSTVKSFPFFLLVAVILLVGCKKDEEPKEKVAINFFSMKLNGQMWVPVQAVHDPCISTFSGGYGTYGEMPFYSFYAYRDPNGRGDAYSENILRMRVANVTKPGIYVLDGTYKNDFDSYVTFVMQQPAGKNIRRYVNNPLRKPFTVIIDEIPVKKGYVFPGIKGSFSGVLYNEDNPSDSLIIEKGKFAYDYMLGGFNHHCGI